MNDRTAYRVEQVTLRIKSLQQQRDNRLFKGLCTICLLLTASLAVTFDVVTKGLPLGIPLMGAFGAVMLRDGADIYVLTGVLAFSAGVTVTALCYRAKTKKQQQEKTMDKKDS